MQMNSLDVSDFDDFAKSLDNAANQTPQDQQLKIQLKIFIPIYLKILF